MTNRVIPKLLLLCTALLLNACSTNPVLPGSGQTAERIAATLAQNGEHADAAARYIGLASAASGAEQDRLTLLAVEQWLFAGDGRRARSALMQVAQPMEPENNWLWTINHAALALWEGRPQQALSRLEPLSTTLMTDEYRLRSEALRGDAWFQAGEPGRAMDIYQQREAMLSGDDALNANRLRLWQGLRVSDVQALRDAAAIATDTVKAGWLSIAALANATRQQGIGWINGRDRWLLQNPEHPAIFLLSDGMENVSLTYNHPQHIALLLPLSGNNAALGGAIRNGFLAAYFNQAESLRADQSIRLYDIEQSGGVISAYQQAVENGSDFVVGPLLRNSATTLASELMLPVPILALNYLPDDVPAPPGFFQYSLSPEDEAASAAQRAIADGHRRAIALVPDNDWGNRLLQSFVTEFEGLGGRILNFRNYPAQGQDFSPDIEGAMALSESIQRYRRLRANLGQALQFEPRRRQDVDMIFLAASAPVGRLIKSQLKFHYSGDVPVYATSFIYAQDGRSNRDLDGVMFADTPWIVAPAAQVENLPEHFERFWPDESRLGRLHAMGFDAYALLHAAFSNGATDSRDIEGVSGTLFFTQDGRVHRRLSWAKFENGVPVHMPAKETLLPTNETDDSIMEWSDLQGSR